MADTYLITGASGRLGAKIIAQLLAHKVEPNSIVALVRSQDKGEEYQSKGVQVRVGSYDDAQSLRNALKGVTRAILVSSNANGIERVNQHKAFIKAAQDASLQLLVYTSIIHADTSPLLLAQDHKATEQVIAQSGLPYSISRNSWYIENQTAQSGKWVQYGSVPGASGQGRVSAASINDYAEAAAKILLSTTTPKKVYEFGGKQGYTLDELAAIASEVLGKPIKAAHLSKEQYAGMLSSAGLPPRLVELFVDAEDHSSRGALLDNSGDLETLLGRPAESIKQVMQASM